MAGQAKQIIYRYNGEPMSDEGFVDWGGHLSPHAVGEIIKRKGKEWRVVAIDDESSVLGTRAIPIHLVTLSDNL